MTITKYTYDNLAGTGFQWHPVTDEGEVLFYPCGELKGVKAFVEACGDLIEDQQADEEHNYGLAFYASNTISHEERENKTYFKINNKSDIEDFLAD